MNFVKWFKKDNMSPTEANNITFNNKRLRIIDNKISLADFICIYCDKNDARTNIKNLKNVDQLIELYKFNGSGQRETPITAIETLDAIITQLPNKIGDQKKSELLKLLEVFIETKPEVITPNPETQVIEDVIEVPVIEEPVQETVQTTTNEPAPISEIIFDNTLPEFSGKTIRVTPDKKISVFDVISVYSGSKNYRRSWADISKSHPEVVRFSDTFKFPGRGQQQTPVMDLKGILKLVMVLPGKRAATTREKFANVLVRYIGGDLTLIDEVIQNKQIQDTLPDNNPLKLEYKKTDEALIIADQLYKQYNLSHIDFDMHSGKQGNYLILCGIHFNIPILKVGETAYNPSERLDSHISKYRDIQDPNFKFIGKPFYFRETIDSRKTERCFLNKLQCNQLYLGTNYKIGNITSRELFTCSDTIDINGIIALMDETIDSVNSLTIEPYIRSFRDEYNIEYERELTKRITEQEKTKQEQERTKQAHERSFQEDKKTHQLELQIELLKLQRS